MRTWLPTCLGSSRDLANASPSERWNWKWKLWDCSSGKKYVCRKEAGIGRARQSYIMDLEEAPGHCQLQICGKL